MDSGATCHYCGTGDELRPYGPGGAPVCFPCGTATPEREAQAQAGFVAQLQAAQEASDDGVTVIGDGPVRPATDADRRAAGLPPAGEAG